uniref:Uncharacterized protein n=1 Tax=Pristionchus pacificus TaxID=54126 RepID=A0A2A6BY16_PRIPA|eukprot:PDM70707.1 hypothetical protein PRIPAC_43912 [Pristionchus pacificus]
MTPCNWPLTGLRSWKELKRRERRDDHSAAAGRLFEFERFEKCGGSTAPNDRNESWMDAISNLLLHHKTI